jgi:hypothetical protein
MFSSRDTVRYEERGQGYRDAEKVGKHCYTYFASLVHCDAPVLKETFYLRTHEIASLCISVELCDNAVRQ